MRQKQFTLKASKVQARARDLLLGELDLDDYQPALPAALVVSLLILASVWQTSLSCACSLLKDPPSREASRKAAIALLPPRPLDLRARLLRALHKTLPGHLLGSPERPAPAVPCAIDLHQRPFYGKKGTKGSTRRKSKAGTHNSFTYATLAALTPWGRFTVGLLLTRPKMRLTAIAEELLAQAQQAGLSVRYLLMDKEFYAAEVVDLLQRRSVAFIVPAEKRPANERLFDPKTPPGFYDYGWEGVLKRYDPKVKRRRQKGKLAVQVRGCVARHKNTGEQLVYATWGLVGWSAADVAETYRRRFGIEASYRQLNSCLARTSSRCERYRLLLVGLALLLCNLWSYLHSEAFALGAWCETRLQLWRMRLLQMAAAVAAQVAALFGGYIDEWQTQRPVPPDFIPDNDPGNY
jgi:putative transposase